MADRFEAKVLKQALTHVRPALSQQTHVPILSHVCFTGDDLYAFDDVLGILTPVRTSFACAVPGEMLLAVVAALPEDAEVELLNSKGKLTVKCGKRSKTQLPVLPSEQFLFDPDNFTKTDQVFRVTEDVQDALKTCLIGVGDTQHRVSLTGITVTGDGDFWSTDNITLTATPGTHKGHKEDDFVLPKAFAEKVATLELSQKTNYYVCLGEGYVTLAEKDGIPWVTHTLMTGKPENWRDVISKSYSKKTPRDKVPDGLESTIARAFAVLRSENRRRINVVIDDGEMTVSAASTAGTPATVEDSFKCDIPDVECTMPLEPVQRALRHFGDWELGFGKQAAAFISPLGDWSHFIAFSQTEE